MNKMRLKSNLVLLLFVYWLALSAGLPACADLLLSVKVSNPRCLSCLKALKENLQTLAGVKRVTIAALDRPPATLKRLASLTIIVGLTSEAKSGPNLEKIKTQIRNKIKQRDFEILSTSFAETQSR